MKRKILIFAGIALLAAGCGAQSQNNGSSQGATNNSLTNAGGGKTYTMAEVQANNSAQKCWTAINGKVYDLTSFVYSHPGGAANILKICGTDGTSAFSAKHGGQARPQNELDSLYIGDLKN